MIKLVDIFNTSELSIVLSTYYNSIKPKHEITLEFTNSLLENLKLAIYNYLDLPTDFETIEIGKSFIENHLKLFGIGLVKEYLNYFESVNVNLAEIHRQSKFNPLDNEHITDAPIRKDDTVYDLESTMLAATHFIIKNRVFTKTFITSILNHCQRVF